MNKPEEVIPRDVVVSIVGGLFACSAPIWRKMMERLAEKYSTEYEATSAYCKKIWGECLDSMDVEDW